MSSNMITNPPIGTEGWTSVEEQKSILTSIKASDCTSGETTSSQGNFNLLKITLKIAPAQELMTIFQIPKLFSGLIIGLSVALAFFILCFIAMVVLAAHLYHQRKNKEPKEDDERKNSTRHYYAENYYDSIK